MLTDLQKLLNLDTAIELLTEKFTTWFEAAIKILPNFAVALIVFFIFLLFAKLGKNISKRLIGRLTKSPAVGNLTVTIVHSVIVLVGLFICLEILSLEKTVTSILAGAGVIGLALGFAFQEIASNFVSGILIALREPYKIGDIVKIEDYFGEITKINLRTTSITTFQGLEVIIPNKDMFTKAFINFTTTPARRLDLSIGVSYGDDLELATKVTKEALESLECRLMDREVEVFFEEFGSSSINLSARMWVNYPGNQAFLKARHEAIIRIKKAYDENNISIPFPIRTLDFGIKGGKSMAEQMQFRDENK